MRNVFDSVREMANYIFGADSRPSKQTPYKVIIDGETYFTLSGNSDQALAAVVRSMSDVQVTAVPIRELVMSKEVI